MNNTRISFATHQGRRKRLEDAFGLSKILLPLIAETAVTILVLCDGVGGSVAGDFASNLAVNTISPLSLIVSVIVAAAKVLQRYFTLK